MLLLTVVYNDSLENIIEDISEIKELFVLKNIQMGLSESIDNGNHFVKIFCDDKDYNINTQNMFNLYFGNVLYKLVIDEFFNKQLDKILKETYFFLKYSEMSKLKSVIKNALRCEGAILDDNSIYCINRKNEIIQKIIKCINDNEEININGFITFRTNEFRNEMECIVDKVIEKYLVEKEYNEFIKLLKYFVDVQECKIDEINLIVEQNGNYLIQDKSGNDIFKELVRDLTDSNYSGVVSVEDIIISGLITNVPKRIVIHCSENCRNKEIIETIKNVFLDRVAFCEGCSLCNSIKNSLKL